MLELLLRDYLNNIVIAPADEIKSLHFLSKILLILTINIVLDFR